MERMNDLRKNIENLREELNESLLRDQYEVYYEKSVTLDKLIEEYIELEAKIPALTALPPDLIIPPPI